MDSREKTDKRIRYTSNSVRIVTEGRKDPSTESPFRRVQCGGGYRVIRKALPK